MPSDVLLWTTLGWRSFGPIPSHAAGVSWLLTSFALFHLVYIVVSTKCPGFRRIRAVHHIAGCGLHQHFCPTAARLTSPRQRVLGVASRSVFFLPPPSATWFPADGSVGADRLLKQAGPGQSVGDPGSVLLITPLCGGPGPLCAAIAIAARSRRDH